MTKEFVINISANKALCKWLNIEPPRIESLDGKRVGTQPLVNEGGCLNFQCQVQHSRHGGHSIVVAIEAHSRYTLIMPFSATPSFNEFEELLLKRWANDLAGWMMQHNILTQEEDIVILFERLFERLAGIDWYANTDMSINSHITDTGLWIEDFRDHFGYENLSEEDVEEIEFRINNQVKSARSGKSAKKETFMPIPRLIDDAIERFDIEPGVVQAQKIPAAVAAKSPNKTAKRKASGNVISMADYRKRSK